MTTMRQIKKFGRDIGREFHPDKVILFGSYAYGKPTEDSDVDVLVVMPHNEKKGHHVATKIRMRVRAGFPLDLIVRTPGQIRERLDLGDCFMKEITAKGKVLYEFPGE